MCHMCCLGPRYVFSFFLCVFHILIDIYRFYLCFGGVRRVQVDNDRQNRPK